MSDELAVEATGLEKSYGKVRVLSGVDLHVERGSVFALLGPNGAGKTTTVRILATLIRADGGHARVAGFDVVRDRSSVRRSISLTGQYAAIDDLQTGAENLRMMGRLAGVRGVQIRQRARALLDQFDLADAGDRRVKTYSGGMRRRLDLAASLVGSPSVIFLDEPTTGLDLQGRQAMWKVVADLSGSGVTVFLTTQYLEEADQLADRIAVVDNGTVVADDTPRRPQTALRTPAAGSADDRSRRLRRAGPRARRPRRHPRSHQIDHGHCHRRQRRARARPARPGRSHPDDDPPFRDPDRHARRRVPGTHRSCHQRRTCPRGARQCLISSFTPGRRRRSTPR
jgi:ABC-2 type transport system ATP-binding protein